MKQIVWGENCVYLSIVMSKSDINLYFMITIINKPDFVPKPKIY